MKKRNTIAAGLLMLGSLVMTAQQDEAKALEKEMKTMKETKADSLKFWSKGGMISINGQQVNLTNWSAGGQNSISAGGLINLFASYKRDVTVWDNNLDFAYGVVKQGNNKNWWKNDDRIQLTSKYGRQAFKNIYYSALLDFKTQYAPGYNYPNDSVKISDFLAPAYGLAAMGFDYKPNADFSLFFAPLTGKFTIVNNAVLAAQGAFGVQKELRDATTNTITQKYKTHREEFGAYLKAQYKRDIMENVSFSTVLELFSNYLNNPGNIDVFWTTLTSMKVNKYISATLSTSLIYDDDINILKEGSTPEKPIFLGPQVQFKQVLAVGFSYKF